MKNPYYNNMPWWGSQNIQGYGDSSGPLDEKKPDRKIDWGKAANNVAAGFSAGMANSQPVGDFTVDQYAGFKGSGQGFASGGPIGAIIGGVTAQVGQFRNVNKELDKLQTGVEGVTYDMYGRPSYAGGNINQAQANISALNKGIKRLNKTHLDPATNIISSVTGTRRKMKRKRAALEAGIRSAQKEFNEAELTNRNQMNQREEYLDRLNNNYYNLYRWMN
jgi:hypothetical protein